MREGNEFRAQVNIYKNLKYLIFERKKKVFIFIRLLAI
ncbi:hypothetical protein KLQUCK387B2_21620 [Klebsiella quasipneumoniae subsp. similipneumoniae]